MRELFNTINISGPDSFKFLQTQITANLEDLNNTLNNSNQAILSAYCNQKGRVVSVFYIYKLSDNNYNLLFLGDTAELFLKKIRKYSVFSKIIFSEVKKIYSLLTGSQSNLNLNLNINLDLNYLINNKIPIITAATSELFLPDNINLIDLNAVSFKKGCFLGQEIIARVYYKGKTKQKLHVIQSEKNLNFLNCSPGENILINNQENSIAGQLVYCYLNIGYIVIEDRFLDQELFINNQKICLK